MQNRRDRGEMKAVAFLAVNDIQEYRKTVAVNKKQFEIPWKNDALQCESLIAVQKKQLIIRDRVFRSSAGRDTAYAAVSIKKKSAFYRRKMKSKWKVRIEVSAAQQMEKI